MTQQDIKQLFLSMKSYQEYDGNKAAFSDMEMDDEILEHMKKISPQVYAPKDMHREVKLRTD